jgi:methionine synthase II (cobalamin-independent)
LAPVNVFVVPDDLAAVEPPYEARLLAELDEIAAAVPHDQLAVQWDVAVEVANWEGVWPVHFADVQQGIIERLVRLGNHVPGDVELGYHLCYGDYEHQHFKQPEDAAVLVEMTNAISAGVERPIQWIHLPVPRDRTDEAYFAPLQHLKLQPGTELYLGLVHFTDSVAGTQERIETAQKFVPDFGVATECGLGRRPAETIPDLLRVHAEVADPLPGA